MLRLVFDTSTRSVSMGILTEEGWMETIERSDIQEQQSKVLFNLIQELLSPFGIEKSEIKEIAVGEGPGSYTGLRMGITVAKVWAFAQNAKLYTFSSGDLLKRTQMKEPGTEFPKVRYLEEADFRPVESINDLSPIYANDHFADA